LHTTNIPYGCEERGRCCWCSICPTAKLRENSLQMLPEFIMGV